MRLNPLISSVALATLAFLYLPMLAVAVLSFNKTRYGLQWSGFTWDWYVRLFNNPEILEAARNTFVLALVSTLIATVLGTLFAIALERYPWPRRVQGFLENLLYLPVVTPDIIFAVALVVAFGAFRAVSSLFEPGLFTMILGHVTFQIAFVALTVRSRLKSLGREPTRPPATSTPATATTCAASSYPCSPLASWPGPCWPSPSPSTTS